MENKGRRASGWVTSRYRDRIRVANQPSATAVLDDAVEPGILSLVAALA